MAASPDPSDAENRKKKVEALKNQAEQWAERKKSELEKQRAELIKRGISPGQPQPTPSPAVPITGALHAIGASDKAEKQPVLKEQSKQPAVPLTNAMKKIGANVPDSAEQPERPKTAQQKKKESILKKLNEKGPSRGKWGAPASPAIKALEEDKERGQWGIPASPTLCIAEQEEEPTSSRSQWKEDKSLRLSDVPLEQTASQMEATSARDQVLKINERPSNAAKQEGQQDREGSRSQWGRGSAVVKVLEKMPICQDTVNLSDSNASISKAASPCTPPVGGIGSTITMSKTPLKGTITISSNTPQTKRPLPMPPERSGTIVLSKDHTADPSDRPFSVPVISPLPPTNIESSTEITEQQQNSLLNTDDKTKDTECKSHISQTPLDALVEVSESQSLSQTQQLKVEKEFAVYQAHKKSQKIENESGKDGSSPVQESNKKDIKDNIRDGAKSVQVNLTTGQFDMENITMLRTCSEPDLANLFRTMKPETDVRKEEMEDFQFIKSPIRRHHSLDLTAILDEDDLINDMTVNNGDDEFAEEEIKLPESDEEDDDNEDEDEDNNNVEDENDDEDDDMQSVMETMQSFLVESGDEGEEQERKIKFKLSGGDNMEIKPKYNQKEKPSKKVGNPANTAKNNDHVDSPRISGDSNDDDDDGDEDEDENQMEQENQELAAALMLGNDEDSDNETTFGDDEGQEEPDFDRFGRLEQCRMELEAELGIGKLIEVYEAIQRLQEEEDGNLEDGTKVAMELLGAKHQHLFPKIFQLVMSDTAFTEDNE